MLVTLPNEHQCGLSYRVRHPAIRLNHVVDGTVADVQHRLLRRTAVQLKHGIFFARLVDSELLPDVV